MENEKKNMTLIVFSNDMDKAMAAFILATGAASSGMKVTMFFTFWGLSLLRKKKEVNKSKDFISKMFGFMLPKGPDDTKISKMNFGGIGTMMMKKTMNNKKMPALETLMNMAITLEVNIVACTTSMEVMGIKKEELIDNIGIGGVATYLGSAKDSGINLFI